MIEVGETEDETGVCDMVCADPWTCGELEVDANAYADVDAPLGDAGADADIETDIGGTTCGNDDEEEEEKFGSVL